MITLDLDISRVAMGVAVAVLAVLNYPVYRAIGRYFYDDWADFSQALLFWITPDSWSLLRGDFMKDIMAELKLAAFAVICAAVIGVELGMFYLIFIAFV